VSSLEGAASRYVSHHSELSSISFVTGTPAGKKTLEMPSARKYDVKVHLKQMELHPVD
jgi:hypothetical protein